MHFAEMLLQTVGDIQFEFGCRKLPFKVCLSQTHAKTLSILRTAIEQLLHHKRECISTHFKGKTCQGFHLIREQLANTASIDPLISFSKENSSCPSSHFLVFQVREGFSTRKGLKTRNKRLCQVLCKTKAKWTRE